MTALARTFFTDPEPTLTPTWLSDIVAGVTNVVEPEVAAVTVNVPITLTLPKFPVCSTTSNVYVSEVSFVADISYNFGFVS